MFVFTLHCVFWKNYALVTTSCFICALNAKLFIPLDPPILTLPCVDLSKDTDGAVNVTANWTLSGGDGADFYFISITTNAPQTPYGGLLNITTASVKHYELTGFRAGYEYNVTVHGVNCGGQKGRKSEPLRVTLQGMLKSSTLKVMYDCAIQCCLISWDNKKQN